MPNAEDAGPDRSSSKSAKSVTGRMSAMKLTTHDMPSPSVDPGVRNCKTLKLLWEKQDWPKIYDLTFFNQDQIAIITYTEVNGTKTKFELRAVDLKGKETAVPFPVFFVRPLAVSGSRDGSALVITDKVKSDKFLIHIYKNNNGNWSTREIERTKSVNPVSLMPTGEIVCGNSSELTMYDLDDKVKWTFELPFDKVSKYVPWISTSPSGHVIVVNANLDTIIVLDGAGQQLRQFPPQFLKLPSSICVDSKDEVVVFDNGNKLMSLFSLKGEYIQKISATDWAPGGIALLNDKYLASRNNDKLFLHEIIL